MTRLFRFVFPVLSVGLLAAAYFLNSLVWPAVGLLVFGIVWIVGLALRWDWVSPLGLFAAFGAAAHGLFLGFSTLLLLASAIFVLLAWDLAEFNIRLRKASPKDDIASLEKRHLVRLTLLALTGGILSAVALTLRLTLSFEWLVILIFFAVWGLGRMVDRLLTKTP